MSKEMTIAEFEKVSNFYYLSGDESNALSAFKYFLNQSDLDVAIKTGPGGPVPYFFYRLAQINPHLWTDYAGFIDNASPDQRLFILWVFMYGSGQTTAGFLRQWLGDKRYKDQHALIREILEERPEVQDRNVLELEAVTSLSQLDLLWTEFVITGAEEPVRRIIGVMEWPDLIRKKLQNSLHERVSEQAPEDYPEEQLRLHLLDNGFIISKDAGMVYSAQDLDSFCVLEGCNRSPERFEAMKSVLPFELSDEDVGHLWMKGSAKWSLCANAQQHTRVRDICVREAEARGGRCRLSLLEILYFYYSAQNDLQQALGYFYQSLTYNQTARQEQKEHADARYVQLLLLRHEDGVGTEERTNDCMNLLSRCRTNTDDLQTYRSKMVWRPKIADPDDAGEMFWELEHIRPDRYRVEQTAGSDFDEWIIMADSYFRGPMFGHQKTDNQSLAEGDIGLTKMLLSDSYLELVRNTDPEDIAQQNSEIGSLLSLGYRDVDPQKLNADLGWHFEEVTVPSIKLWFEAETCHLLRVDISLKFSGDGEESGELDIVHMFAGQNDEILIIPPPFEIVKYNDGIAENQELSLSQVQGGALRSMWKGLAPLSLPWKYYFILAITYGYIDPIGLFEVSAAVGQVIELIVITIAIFFSISIWRCAWNTEWKGWGYISRIAVVILASIMVYGWITKLFE